MRFLIISFILILPLFSQSKVYQVTIDDEINLSTVPYVKRVIKEAELHNADGIIVRLNTLGGRVDAAIQIKDALLNTKLFTIAFIDKRAISAGALLALSCKKIAMVEGATFGASTVVDNTGKKQSEKYQSFMRSEMRTLAEKNNRNVKLAEAMVDERIVIEGLVNSSQLLTLTTNEALKYKMADTSVATINDVSKAFGIKDSEIIDITPNIAEKIVNFLSNPVVSSILIMLGIIGLSVELKTPGWGFAGTVGIISLVLFFGSGIILNIASVFEILLFVVGLVLLILEIFFIPGFGITGILGIIMIFASIFLGLIGDLSLPDPDLISKAIIQLGIVMTISILTIALIWKFLPESKIGSKLILKTSIEGKTGQVKESEMAALINETGIAQTDLRPAGIVIIKNKKYDVVSDGMYVSRGERIIVKSIDGIRLIVAKNINGEDGNNS